MRVLGIDPGYERLGIAVIDKNQGEKEVLRFSECFKTSSKLPHPDRLALIKKEIEKIISEYKPEIMAIETLFFNTNQKTAFMVSEARGTVISTGRSAGLEIFEFGPTEIKNAITSYGRSDKNAVIKMLHQLIHIEKEVKHDDEYDAIAVGLTYCASAGKL